MNQFKLYLLFRKHGKLNLRRHPMYEQNMAAKVFVYISIAIMGIYLVIIGTMLGSMSEGGYNNIIIGGMPIVLLVDFFMRFGMQQTPAILVKPYLTLPLKKKSVIDFFIANSLLAGNNSIWQAMFIPYTFVAVCGGMKLGYALLLIVACQMLVLINSQWYMLVRTLVRHKVYWWGLAIMAYSPFIILYVADGYEGLARLVAFFAKYGFHPIALVLYCLVLCGLVAVNRTMQLKFATDETGKKDAPGLKHVSSFHFLENFGLIGEYLKLEMKSMMRNKSIKQRYIQGVCIILMLSCLLAYTDIYDGSFTTNLWCLYCFVFFGAVNLVKIMGPEGNYIDLLMVHKENIYTLLKAKYYFFCIVLLLPLLMLLPPIISGKFSLLMVAAYLLITSGLEYFILFQLAVYNKTALPLNEKITGKGNAENSVQMIVSFVVFFLPVILSTILTAVFGDTVGYMVMAAVGLAFTLTYPLWLKNIYNRMMKRHYENLEGFHSTR